MNESRERYQNDKFDFKVESVGRLRQLRLPSKAERGEYAVVPIKLAPEGQHTGIARAVSAAMRVATATIATTGRGG